MVAIPARQEIITGDCLAVLPTLADNSIDVCVTSPPYNLGIKYATYDDTLPPDEYLPRLTDVFAEIKRVLKDDGSFFLNMGYTNLNPWVSTEVSLLAGDLFTLQNRITWVKSITVGETTTGHFKPINSGRFLNYTTEDIFHFTKRGDVKIDRLAIGVPYADKTNIARFKREADLRCRGNAWFIPYETSVQNRRKGHPARFPVALPEQCIKLHGLSAGMMVLDPFAGLGTTLAAAKRLGVNAIGIEIAPVYSEMAQCVPVTWQKSDRGLFLPTLGGRGRYIEIVDGRKRIVVKSLAQGV